LSSTYLPDAEPAEIAQLLQYYPNSDLTGSPFGTGLSNHLAPQYKRIAALQGDMAFQAPRRAFMSHIAQQGTQKMWGYCKL
jgi:acetylcholinesterase